MKITKEEALKKSEELKKYVDEEEQKEKKKTVIYSRTGSILYESNKETVKGALVEAVGDGANLSGANLPGAEFCNAKFYGKGGTVRLKKEQVKYFLVALGFLVED